MSLRLFTNNEKNQNKIDFILSKNEKINIELKCFTYFK